MTQVTRKSEQEALENMIRRFNRKVMQSGLLANARRRQYREKPHTKREKREAAIIKARRREERLRRMYLGR